MKFIFKYPEKKKFLVFDRSGSEVFKSYLNSKEYSILDRRYESINIPIFLKSLLRFDLNCKISEKYFLTYLECVQPKLLLTFIENNPIFYTLKSKKFKFKKAFVQNGNGFIQTIQNYSLNKKNNIVDYMFVFNKDYAKIFSKYISGKTIVIGSFKNNHKKIKKKRKKNRKILFISQWREFETDTYPYYKKTEKLMIFLNNYCLRNKKELIIAGAFNKEKTREKNYYVKILKNQQNICNFKFVPKKKTYSNYQLLDNSEVIITLDSALGYEAFARGCKVIFYNFRSNLNGHKYGWPGKFKNEGPFWINKYDEKKLKIKIDYLFRIENNSWMKKKKNLIHQKIYYDHGNSIFLKIIKKI